MKEILHHLGWSKPYKQWDKPTGAGFLPSTVSIHVIRYFYWTIISKVVG
jgi:hypothetical protein